MAPTETPRFAPEGTGAPGRAQVDAPTLRTDRWWLAPLVTVAVLRAQVVQPRRADPARADDACGLRVGQHEVVAEHLVAGQSEALQEVGLVVEAEHGDEVPLAVQHQPVVDAPVEVDGQRRHPQR
jgi:hypothetical protein